MFAVGRAHPHIKYLTIKNPLCALLLIFKGTIGYIVPFTYVYPG
jgi:hypothetical protein